MDKNSKMYKILGGIVTVVAIVFYIYISINSNNSEDVNESSETESSMQVADSTEPSSSKEEASSKNDVDTNLIFRNKELLDQHYEKHGIEMGFKSAEEYLETANKVLENEDVLHKVEAEDSDDVYYLEETNEFVVVSKDGYIRTYFNPSDGIDYFNRQ
ncbi:MAG: hypothetical protein J6L69_00940 [Lachnospiraceae bacterium]|nr:hypothetical protein [Lachnospiraceae bacterium]